MTTVNELKEDRNKGETLGDKPQAQDGGLHDLKEQRIDPEAERLKRLDDYQNQLTNNKFASTVNKYTNKAVDWGAGLLNEAAPGIGDKVKDVYNKYMKHGIFTVSRNSRGAIPTNKSSYWGAIGE